MTFLRQVSRLQSMYGADVATGGPGADVRTARTLAGAFGSFVGLVALLPVCPGGPIQPSTVGSWSTDSPSAPGPCDAT